MQVYTKYQSCYVVAILEPNKRDSERLPMMKWHRPKGLAPSLDGRLHQQTLDFKDN
jgi:hypothetical protein